MSVFIKTKNCDLLFRLFTLICNKLRTKICTFYPILFCLIIIFCNHSENQAIASSSVYRSEWMWFLYINNIAHIVTRKNFKLRKLVKIDMLKEAGYCQ